MARLTKAKRRQRAKPAAPYYSMFSKAGDAEVHDLVEQWGRTLRAEVASIATRHPEIWDTAVFEYAAYALEGKVRRAFGRE